MSDNEDEMTRVTTSSDESDDDVPVRTTKRRAAIVSDDEDSDGSTEDVQSSDANGETNADSNNANEETNVDSENANEERNVDSENTIRPSLSFSQDVYDAEDSSDDETGDGHLPEGDGVLPDGHVQLPTGDGTTSQDNVSDNDSSSSDDDSDNDSKGSSSDSGMDDTPVEMSAQLRKRLAQGAGKKSKPGGSGGGGRKKKSEEDQEPRVNVHSESQRIVRESDVRLPYHKPGNLSITSILQRAKQKQNLLQSGRDRSCGWKKAELLPKLEPLQTTQGGASGTVVSRSVTADTDCAPPPSLTAEDNDSSDDDYLPDLSTRIHASQVKKTLEFTEEVAGGDVATEDVAEVTEEGSKTDGNTQGMSDSEDLESCRDNKSAVGSKEDTLSGNHVGLADEDSLARQCVGLVDSGIVDCDVLTINVEQSKDIELLSDSEGERQSEPGETWADKPILGVTPPKTSPHRTPPAKTLGKTTPERTLSALKALKSSKLTPKLMALSMCDAPKLSGAGSSMVSLGSDSDDDNEPTVFDKLVDKVVMHSRPGKQKAQKTIEMSAVSKKGTSDKCELQLEKFTVTLDDDDKEVVTHKPGAVRCKLKDRLKVAMAMKREEQRLRRQEASQMDNEEGYNEDDYLDNEEEEELTDCETDEEMEQEADDEEEEGDEGNPFMDAEAEDEDGGDTSEAGSEDEMNLHLELDSQDLPEDNSNASSIAPKPTLHKQKTLDLYDDEANSESPTTSQGTQKTVVSVSARPFLELSQGTNLEDSIQSEASKKSKMDDQDSKSSKLNEDMNSSRWSLFSKENSISSADVSIDLMGSLIPAGQRTGKKNRSFLNDGRSTPDVFTPNQKTNSNNKSKFSELSLPMEDSQDSLARMMDDDSPGRVRSQSTPKFMLSQTFGMDDSGGVSQYLESDDLLKSDSVRKPACRQLKLDTSQSTTELDELLGLCSGKFTESDSPDPRRRQSGLFGGISQLMDNSQATEDDELLGLCSGRFPANTNDSTNLSGTQSVAVGGAQTDGETLDLFPLSQCETQNVEKIRHFSGSFKLSEDSPKVEKKKKKGRVIDDGDEDSVEEVDNEEEVENEVEEEEEAFVVSDGNVSEQDSEQFDDERIYSSDEETELVKKFTGFKSKKGRIREDFVDEEAELSGSEGGSDEDDNLGDDADVMEMLSGDEDNVGTEEHLRDEVGRVHYKSLADEEARQIQLMQEMLLPDGDLHGEARNRKFRWKHIDNDSQADMFETSDVEDDNEDEQMKEAQWRKEKQEREKFLQELQEKDPSSVRSEGSSTMIELGKISRQNSQPLPTSSNKENVSTVPATVVFKKPTTRTRGTFINQKNLSQMSEFCKTAGNARTLPTPSSKHVYSVTEQKSDEQEQDMPPMRRSMSSVSSLQAAKKPRLEKSTSLPSNSVFHHL